MTGTARTPDFWSRRRASVRAEAEAERAALTRTETEAEIASREAEAVGRSDDEILAELGLPDPDTMGQGDDFAAFLRSAVPERLRRRALRRLWRSNPVLANLDGLIDHGEDFTDKAVVVPGMVSAYQVGRGMMRHVMTLSEMEEAADDTVAVPDAEPEEATQDEPVEETLAAAGEAGSGPAVPRRRHIRFSFADSDAQEVHP